MRYLISITITLGFDNFFILNETVILLSDFLRSLTVRSACVFRLQFCAPCFVPFETNLQIGVSFHVVIVLSFLQEFCVYSMGTWMAKSLEKESARTTWKLTSICLDTQTKASRSFGSGITTRVIKKSEKNGAVDHIFFIKITTSRLLHKITLLYWYKKLHFI